LNVDFSASDGLDGGWWQDFGSGEFGGHKLSEVEKSDDDDSEDDHAEDVSDHGMVLSEKEPALCVKPALAWRLVILPAERELRPVVSHAVVWRRTEFKGGEVHVTE
jgi:hypothetical protein